MADSLVDRTIQAERTGRSLRYAAARDGVAPRGERWMVDRIDLSELSSLAGGTAPDAKRSAILCNGWQSWSSAWELYPGERMRRARFIPRLNLFTDRPGLRIERAAEVSHFFTWIREGEDYLVLASRNAGGPPVSFRTVRGGGADGNGSVEIFLYAAGQALRSGQALADIRVFRASGYFALRDAFSSTFGDFGLFDRLAFLCAKGEKLVPGGYESWYNHYADIDEATILGDLEGLLSFPNLIKNAYLDRGKPAVFQVDDGWETRVGEWTVNAARFPRGLKPIADAAAARGLVPGLWFAPFIVTKGARVMAEKPEWILRDTAGKPVPAAWMPAWGGDFYALDLSLPDVLDYIEGFIRQAVDEWGFRYLKLDFLYAGMLPGAHSRGGAAWEHYEAALKRITSVSQNAKGEPVAFLGCGAPLESSFRYLPLMRIGADTQEEWDHFPHRILRHQARPSALNSLKNTVGRAVLDGTVFVNDPDVIFCRSDNMRLSSVEREAVALGAILLGSQIMFSDDASRFAPADRAFTERLLDIMETLQGAEFGATRIDAGRPLLFRLDSRDGAFAGIMNLGDKPEAADGPWKAGRAITDHRLADGRFGPRSVSLFGVA